MPSNVVGLPLTITKLKNNQMAYDVLSKSNGILIDINKSTTRNPEYRYFLYKEIVYGIKTDAKGNETTLQITKMDFSKEKGCEVVNLFHHTFRKRRNIDSYLVFFLDIQNDILYTLDYDRSNGDARPNVDTKIIDFFKLGDDVSEIKGDDIILLYQKDLLEQYPNEDMVEVLRGFVTFFSKFREANITIKRENMENKVNVQEQSENSALRVVGTGWNTNRGIIEEGVFTPFALKIKSEKFVCLDTLMANIYSNSVFIYHQDVLYKITILATEVSRSLSIVKHDINGNVLETGFVGFETRDSVTKYPSIRTPRHFVLGLDTQKVYIVETKDVSAVNNTETVKLIRVKGMVNDNRYSLNALLDDTVTVSSLEDDTCYYLSSVDLATLAIKTETLNLGFHTFISALKDSFKKANKNKENTMAGNIKVNNTDGVIDVGVIKVSDKIMCPNDFKAVENKEDWINLSSFKTDIKGPFLVYWSGTMYSIGYAVERGVIDYLIRIYNENDIITTAIQERTLQLPIKGSSITRHVFFNKKTRTVHYVDGDHNDIYSLTQMANGIAGVRTMYPKNTASITMLMCRSLDEVLNRSDIGYMNEQTAYRIPMSHFYSVRSILSKLTNDYVNFSKFIKMLKEHLEKFNIKKTFLLTTVPDIESLASTNLNFIELLGIPTLGTDDGYITYLEIFLYYKDNYYKLTVDAQADETGRYSRKTVKGFKLKKMDPNDPNKDIDYIEVGHIGNSKPDTVDLYFFAPDTGVIYNLAVKQELNGVDKVTEILTKELSGQILTANSTIYTNPKYEYKLANGLHPEILYYHRNVECLARAAQSSISEHMSRFGNSSEENFFNTIKELKERNMVTNENEVTELDPTDVAARAKLLSDVFYPFYNADTAAYMANYKINVSRFLPTREAPYEELCYKLADASAVILELLKTLREIKINAGNAHTELSTKLSLAINNAMWKDHNSDPASYATAKEYFGNLGNSNAECENTSTLIYTKAADIKYLRGSNLKYIELLDLVNWNVNTIHNRPLETYIYYKDRYYKLSVTPNVKKTGSYGRETIHSFTFEELDPMDPAKTKGSVTITEPFCKDPNKVSLILFAPETGVIYNYTVDKELYRTKGVCGILLQDLPIAMVPIRPVMINNGPNSFKFVNELESDTAYLYINEHYAIHRLQYNRPIDLEQTDTRNRYFYSVINNIKEANDIENFVW